MTAVDFITNGVWQYTTNGGTLCGTAFGTPSATTARLLTSNASTLIRFVPNADWNGTATITYRAWDQTSGTAGNTADVSTNGTTTAFSSATASPSITVNAVNDAPVFVSASNFTSITEDQTTNAGQLVSTLFSSTTMSIPVRSTASRSTARRRAMAPGSTRPMAARPGMALARSPVRRPCSCARPITCASCPMRITRTPLRSVSTSGIRPPVRPAPRSMSRRVVRQQHFPLRVARPRSRSPPSMMRRCFPAPATSRASPKIRPPTPVSWSRLCSPALMLIRGAVNSIALYSPDTAAMAPGSTPPMAAVPGMASAPFPVASALLLRSTDYVRFVPDAHNADAASIGFYIWDQTSGSTGTKVDVSITRYDNSIFRYGRHVLDHGHRHQ